MNWWSTSARTGEYVDDGFALLISHVLEADKRNRTMQEIESPIHNFSHSSSSTSTLHGGKRNNADSTSGAFKIGHREGSRDGVSPGNLWMTQPSGVCW